MFTHFMDNKGVSRFFQFSLCVILLLSLPACDESDSDGKSSPAASHADDTLDDTPDAVGPLAEDSFTFAVTGGAYVAGSQSTLFVNGETLTLTITFDRTVYVDSSAPPKILTTANSNNLPNGALNFEITYTSGSGSRVLVFEHEVGSRATGTHSLREPFMEDSGSITDGDDNALDASSIDTDDLEFPGGITFNNA